MTIFNIKSVKPKGIRTKEIRLEILNALRKEGRKQRDMLKGTVQYWTGARPTFEFKVSLAGGDAMLLVGPAGNTEGAKKWRWLDEGTRPHIIRPRRAPRLRFKVGGQAGSTPGSLSVRPARSGTEWRSAQVVRHPGTEARNWSIQVYEKRYKAFFEEINKAVERGLKKAI